MVKWKGAFSMKNLIQENWCANQLPGIDSIVYPNGKLTILNCHSIYNPNSQERNIYCSPLCDTTIESLENYHSDCWTNVDAWTSIDYQHGKIYGGAGAMGNEGFLACVDANEGLVWGIFFENSNPIKKLTITEKTLAAINEHEDMRIEIDLDRLVNIEMTYIR